MIFLPGDQRDDDNSPAYAYGQAGISAHIVTLPNEVNERNFFLKNENLTRKVPLISIQKIEEMIIGAPGAYEWRGTVIRLKKVDDRNIPPQNQRRKRQSSTRLLQITEVADVKKLP